MGGGRRRAEYSAAVSRLADSLFSCSESATRGKTEKRREGAERGLSLWVSAAVSGKD